MRCLTRGVKGRGFACWGILFVTRGLGKREGFLLQSCHVFNLHSGYPNFPPSLQFFLLSMDIYQATYIHIPGIEILSSDTITTKISTSLPFSPLAETYSLSSSLSAYSTLFEGKTSCMT